MSVEANVYILEDDASRSAQLSQLLGSVGLKSVVYQDAAEFLMQHEPGGSGCLVLDVRMPKIGGLQVQQELKRQKSNLAVVFLTECHDVAVAVEALKRGAVEFITKPYSEQKLIDSIFSAIAVSEKWQYRRIELVQIEICIQGLTKRERQVLAFVAEGMINKVISKELFISSKTVEMHRANIMKKMQAKSLADLIRKYTLFRLSQSELV